MNPEKELILLVKLYHSPPRKGGLFKQQTAWCKADFEKYFGYEIRNKEIRTWIDSLVEAGCLKDVGFESRNGNQVKVYLVDKDRLERIIRSNENYDLFWGMFQEKTFLGLPLDK